MMMMHMQRMARSGILCAVLAVGSTSFVRASEPVAPIIKPESRAERCLDLVMGTALVGINLWMIYFLANAPYYNSK